MKRPLLKQKLASLLSIYERSIEKNKILEIPDEVKVIRELLNLVETDDALSISKIREVDVFISAYEGGSIWFDLSIIASELKFSLEKEYKSDVS